MADARKNTLLYHFNAMNVVKAMQKILKCESLDVEEDMPANLGLLPWFSEEEIHKVLLDLFFEIY